MPNWVYTSFEIRGPKEDMRKFMTGMGLDFESVDQKCEILKTYFPTPPELMDRVAGFFSPTNLYDLKTAVLRGESSQEDYDREEENLRRDEECIAKYGYKNWYDWQYDKWGTKWGDCNTYLLSQIDNQLVFQLESAWSPIEVGLTEVSIKFPTLTFELEMLEESGEYAGLHVMKEGNTLFYEEFAPGEMISDFEKDGENFDYDVYDDFIEEKMHDVRTNYNDWKKKEVK